jgi:hypothetical protein
VARRDDVQAPVDFLDAEKAELIAEIIGFRRTGCGKIFSEKFSGVCAAVWRGSSRATWCDTATGAAYS